MREQWVWMKRGSESVSVEADTYPNIFSGQRRNYDLYFGLNIYASCITACILVVACTLILFSFVSIVTRFLSTMESCKATF